MPGWQGCRRKAEGEDEDKDKKSLIEGGGVGNDAAAFRIYLFGRLS